MPHAAKRSPNKSRCAAPRRVLPPNSFKLGVPPALLRVLPMDTPVTLEGGVQARSVRKRSFFVLLSLVCVSRTHAFRIRTRARVLACR
jgi:hypothetical protein